MTELPSMGARARTASLGLPATGGGSGQVVLDLRSEPIVELRLVDTPAEQRLERGGLLEATRWQRVVKRWMDVFGSLFLLILLLPILMLTAAAVGLSSRGPVLFVQERIGRDGAMFRMFKFRSMKVRAHEVRDELLHLNQAGGPVFKMQNDPRITRVGRVIRKLSIDELPQLLNVLRGDMSLVGPRPPLPGEYETYGPHERRRLAVTPGITCIWQVSGRSDVDFDTWVDMDLEYIETWNIRLDLKLLLLTVPAVVSGRGAY